MSRQLGGPLYWQRSDPLELHLHSVLGSTIHFSGCLSRSAVKTRHQVRLTWLMSFVDTSLNKFEVSASSVFPVCRFCPSSFGLPHHLRKLLYSIFSKGHLLPRATGEVTEHLPVKCSEPPWLLEVLEHIRPSASNKL